MYLDRTRLLVYGVLIKKLTLFGFTPIVSKFSLNKNFPSTLQNSKSHAASRWLSNRMLCKFSRILNFVFFISSNSREFSTSALNIYTGVILFSRFWLPWNFVRYIWLPWAFRVVRLSWRRFPVKIADKSSFAGQSSNNLQILWSGYVRNYS